MKKQTQAIHTRFQQQDSYNALSMPVYHTVAYEFDNADAMSDAFCGRSDAPDYSRVMNPTVTFFENKVKTLTGAREVIAFNSGMAAISNTLLAIASAGKNIVASRHLFGNTYSFITGTLARFGVTPRLCDMTDIDSVKQAVDEHTCCIFLEIISNPQMEVADLQRISQIAREKGVPLIADTTLIPFTQCNAHELGVDIEVVSSTKHLSGGATSIGGLVLDYGTCEGFGKQMRTEMLLNLGAYMTPHAAYMQSLGLETLDARYRIQTANASALAERLRTLTAIRRVNYVGLADNPYHELVKKQFGGSAGAMITIELESREACFRFINSLKLIRRATNLFDNKTLAIHPASTIFGTFTAEQRQAMNIKDTIIRLSIGLEDADDLFEDIKQALEKQTEY